MLSFRLPEWDLDRLSVTFEFTQSLSGLGQRARKLNPTKKRFQPSSLLFCTLPWRGSGNCCADCACHRGLRKSTAHCVWHHAVKGDKVTRCKLMQRQEHGPLPSKTQSQKSPKDTGSTGASEASLSDNMCVCMCAYVNLHAHGYACMCTGMSMSVCMCLRIYVPMFRCNYVRTCVSMSLRICVTMRGRMSSLCMCLHMCVVDLRLCVCICLCVCVYVRMYAFRMYACAHVCMCTRMRACTC